MKKVSLLLLAFMSISLMAQNVQLHYDFAKDRKFPTTTVEMFKPDKLGNTFFFIDMDYQNKGVGLAYWELARVFKTDKMPVGVHAEFNSGIAGPFPINSAFLTGVDYSLNAKDFSKGITFKALYKYIYGKHNASFQLTSVWYWNFLNNKISFTGFADFWKEDVFDQAGLLSAEYVFLTEPQLWYNFHKHFSVGGEIEISNNFVAKGFKVRPTLALKWTI